MSPVVDKRCPCCRFARSSSGAADRHQGRVQWRAAAAAERRAATVVCSSNSGSNALQAPSSKIKVRAGSISIQIQQQRRTSSSSSCDRRSAAATEISHVQARKSGLTIARSNRISTPNMETAMGPVISALCSAATGRVGSNSTPLLPQRRERHNAILGGKTGTSSLPVGESGRRRTEGV